MHELSNSEKPVTSDFTVLHQKDCGLHLKWQHACSPYNNSTSDYTMLHQKDCYLCLKWQHTCSPYNNSTSDFTVLHQKDCGLCLKWQHTCSPHNNSTSDFTMLHQKDCDLCLKWQHDKHCFICSIKGWKLAEVVLVENAIYFERTLHISYRSIFSKCKVTNSTKLIFCLKIWGVYFNPKDVLQKRMCNHQHFFFSNGVLKELNFGVENYISPQPRRKEPQKKRKKNIYIYYRSECLYSYEIICWDILNSVSFPSLCYCSGM